MARVVAIAAALLCLAIAAALMVLPGPALPFFFLGGGLLAKESRLVARFMDACEVWMRRVVAWLRPRWRALPVWGRIVAGVVAASLSITATYLSLRVFGD